MAANSTDLFKKLSPKWVGNIGAAGVANGTVETIPLTSASNLATDTAVVATINRVDANGAKTTGGVDETIIGVVSGNNLINCVRGVEGTAQAHTAGQVVEILVTSRGYNDIIDGILTEHNQDGTHKDTLVTSLKATGAVVNTGTSDVTIVTPKALADSDYAKTTDITVTPDSTTTFSNKTLTSPKINEDVALTATSTQLNALVSGSSDGSISAAETWTYASASTITVPSGAAAKYAKGDRIRWKQGAGYKYGVLTAVADTLLTIAVNNDYTVATPTAITDNYFSHQESPIGYPQYFNFTPSWTNLTPGAGTNTGNYSIIGKTLFMRVKFIFGGGSAVGAAEVKLTFPVTPAASNAGFLSTTQIVDAGTATFLGLMDASGVLFIYTTSVGYVATGAPMGWTTNDALYISANYEIA